jgi:hypothetical protein
VVVTGGGRRFSLGLAPLAGADEVRTFVLTSDDVAPHWLRIDVRGPDGKLWLLGNPIYLNPAKPGR